MAEIEQEAERVSRRVWRFLKSQDDNLPPFWSEFLYEVARDAEAMELALSTAQACDALQREKR
jgi:hypothetical protein